MAEQLLLTLQNTSLLTTSQLLPIKSQQCSILYSKSSHSGLVIVSNRQLLIRIDKVYFSICNLHEVDKITWELEIQPALLTLKCFTANMFKFTGPAIEIAVLTKLINSLISPDLTMLLPSLLPSMNNDAFEFVFQENERTISQPYEDQEVSIPPSGHLLFDPIAEFKRLNVAIQPPTEQQLSQMIFGQRIHKDLLKFLLTKKPRYSPDLVFQLDDQFTQIIMENNNYIDQDFRNYLILFRQHSNYDPRSLFDDDESFYYLLSQHPQALHDNIEDEDDLIIGEDDDPELEEVVSVSDSQPQNTSLVQSFVSIFKTEEPKQATKRPVILDQQSLNFDHKFYCHGVFFAPTFFRCHPGMRHYLVKFVKQTFKLSQNSQSSFKMSFTNCTYHFSPTYPCLLGIPGSISDQTLQKCMKFRSRGRIAALSWLSKDGIPIVRCSQPGKGFGLTRESADEHLLKDICGGQRLMVFDARPKLSAIGNRFTGKGFESERAYPFSRTFYCNIQNIHVVRESYEDIRKFIMKISENFPSVMIQTKSVNADQLNYQYAVKQLGVLELRKSIQKTGWIEHIQSILVSAQFIAYTISVLKIPSMIHCSDGWDRTSQLSGLSMMQLDPYYRTLRGFLILLEKEWISFGHMFATRLHQSGSSKANTLKDKEKLQLSSSLVSQLEGLQKSAKPIQIIDKSMNFTEIKGVSSSKLISFLPSDPHHRFSSSQTSPVFIQFLDCVFQFVNQKPQYFEFNNHLIIYILREIYSRGGSFQFDSDYLRTQHLHWMINKSSWDFVLDNSELFINRGFVEDQPKPFLSFSSAVEDIAIWPGLWLF